MSIERMSGQGYAPIPQSMSNTDTEEEDVRLSVPIDNCRRDEASKMHNTLGGQENGWCQGAKELRHYAKDPTDSQVGYRYCGDQVPIMVAEAEARDDFWKRREMSTIRRCCLVLSILLCCVTSLVFLYVLPCDNGAICPPVAENQPVITWDKTLEGVELHGPISIVHGTPYSLIFLLRGQRYGVNATATPANREIPPEGGVVLSMQGNTGTPLWWVPLTKKLPADIDCTSLDTDGSKSPDCIVTGDDLLVSIDPTAGTIHWTSSYATNSRLPLIIPDVDSDGIDDLLSVTQHGYPQGGIVLLSGKTGKLLGEHANEDCDSYERNTMRLVSFESNDDISYTCQAKKYSNQVLNLTVPLSELLHSNHSIPAEIGAKNASNNNSPSYFSTTDEDENTDDYSLPLSSTYELNVRNFGSCPGDDCRVSVNVTTQKIGGPSRVVWNYSRDDTYATRPAVLSTGEGPYDTGFAIKFWHWNDDNSISNVATDQISKRRITERVMMVFFDHNDVHEINASQSDIVQLCKSGDCQPTLKMQARSIAIADLGGDGTWELINYQSTYSNEPATILISRVQIVKLDLGLSQLTQTTEN